MKKILNNSESGQAMMELTIMLLILTGMILAVVMLSGVEMRSNTLLLSARSNAHRTARESGASTETLKSTPLGTILLCG